MAQMNSKYDVSYMLNVLDFWHKVEFFIPFDLEREVRGSKDTEWLLRSFTRSELRTLDSNSLWNVLPRNVKNNQADNQELTGFDVYLGVFDTRELADVTQQVVKESLTPQEILSQEERDDTEGETCFARLKLNADGEPIWENLSVSTAPWAIGQITHKGIDSLDYDRFLSDMEQLKKDLLGFRAKRSIQGSNGLSSDSFYADEVCPLTEKELEALLEILYKWANFKPKSSYNNGFEILIKNRLGRKSKSEAKIQQNNKADDNNDDEIDILNSFYAEDIAKTIDFIRGGGNCPTLLTFLSRLPESQRIDLYSPEGKQKIIRSLSPKHMNRGHWPEQPEYSMSLMQQFAINSIFTELEGHGVFSINGPPGTGKTTLLKEVFAENIVKRASILSRYENSRDAFKTNKTVVNFIGGTQACFVSELKDELTGFEMVVASTNNAAVENISNDLPKNKALGQYWRSERFSNSASYLQTVAHNVASKKGGNYEELSSDDEPWGLIACALGRKSNRLAFQGGLFFDGLGSNHNPETDACFDPIKHQNLWNWRKDNQCTSFAEARQEFLRIQAEVEGLIALLDEYNQLIKKVGNHTEQTYQAQALGVAEEIAQQLILNNNELDGLNKEIEQSRSQLTNLKEIWSLNKLSRPKLHWFIYLFKKTEYQKYKTKQEDNRQQQLKTLDNIYKKEMAFEEAQNISKVLKLEHDSALKALNTSRKEWQQLSKFREKLQNIFPEAIENQCLDDIEQDICQIKGLWFDKTLNVKRTELFIAALNLHEAWLSEVLQKDGGFGTNAVAISNLLSGARVENKAHVLSIWQSIFMIVPVISCTFASYARQFKELGANSLGWLFIDEAGQAVPQAAVGALWRAQRAVVVGDPLQIEPVFTVPIKLLEALRKSSKIPLEANVSPDKVSVQQIADRVNLLGAELCINEMTHWVGSPLRVHRRCVDPMFSIANEIAYDGKMIFFDPFNKAKRLPPKDILNFGVSSWVHISGETSSKQTVPEQIKFVKKALCELFHKNGELPKLYIITPFKQIKKDIIAELLDHNGWTEAEERTYKHLDKTELTRWCRSRVGTVHTFQGKEESMVWMVLGCDENNRGAASWASSKPNILNVALTRAKHRFFMIGNVDVWGNLANFKSAKNMLPIITENDFIERIRSLS